MSGLHSELTDCKPTTMTGTIECSGYWETGVLEVNVGMGFGLVLNSEGPVDDEEVSVLGG